MLNREINDELKNMSYEKQREVLDMIKDMDTQAYDDSCNVVEVVVDAVINVITAVGRLIFK